MNAKTMRKAAAVLVLATLVPLAMNAQNESRPLRLGLALAPNMGWIKPGDKKVESDGSKLGFKFGLLMDVRIGANANYAFSTGVFLNNAGFKYANTVSVTDSLAIGHKASVNVQYVELPLSIKLKTNEIGYMTYFGQLGFDAGLRVGAKADHEYTPGGIVTLGDDEDATDDVAEFRAALIVGAGFEYNFSGNTSALVGLKYSNGFTNVFDNDNLGKAKQHYAELTLGVLF